MNPQPNVSSPQSQPPAVPELLAPAGDRRCAEAAVAAGADAVYFGLATGTNFNARARAKNIPLSELDNLIAWLHRHGVKGYVTLNTLVFPGELEEAEQVLRHVAASGADAVLVQDLGVARLARAVCPTLPIHASTQMSLTSAEGIRAVESLGIQRVILARELSIDDIRRIANQTRLTLEVFVHGALCISYSGQCLASRTLGARSANRGDCAQLCRLAYQLVCDARGGRESFSRAAGKSLPARGRLSPPWKKTPDPFAPSAKKYLLSPMDLAAYTLVPELIRAGVGALKIEGRLKSAEYVAVVTQHYRRAIDAAMAEQDPHFSQDEIRHLEAAFSRGFSHGWLEGDHPKKLVTGLSSAGRRTLLGKVGRVLRRRVWLDLVVEAEIGRPLRIRGRAASGACCQVESAEPLAEAVKHPLSETLLAEQLGRLGATPYRLRGLEAKIVGRPLAPLSVLGRLRREIIAQLDSSVATEPRAIAAEPQLARLRATIPGPETQGHGVPEAGEPRLHVLCRSPQQLRAALAFGARSVIAEYQDIAAYGDAVHTARQRHAEIFLATPRIQRPGETWVFRAIAEHKPDGALVRNAAALDFFRSQGLPVVADFSLNAANELTVQWLCEQGACRVTPCYDLSRSQLQDLVAAAPLAWLEVAIHLHVPMFHTQHCLFCAHLSAGSNSADCGRPCRPHVVRLEDRKGIRHLVVSDGLCRNTVYQAVPQSAAEVVPWLVARGVRHFRIELLDEQGDLETRQIIEVYQELLAGRISGREAWGRLRAITPGGVTRGTLR